MIMGTPYQRADHVTGLHLGNCLPSTEVINGPSYLGGQITMSGRCDNYRYVTYHKKRLAPRAYSSVTSMRQVPCSGDNSKVELIVTLPAKGRLKSCHPSASIDK